MVRHFLCAFAFFACLSCVTGCGSGGEAKYDPSQGVEPTAEDLKAAEDYAKQYEAQNAQPSGQTSPGN